MCGETHPTRPDFAIGETVAKKPATVPTRPEKNTPAEHMPLGRAEYMPLGRAEYTDVGGAVALAGSHTGNRGKWRYCLI